MVFHNPAVRPLVPDGDYSSSDLQRVEAALAAHRTLSFVRLRSGLYSASSAGDSIASTGYGNVWVRDCVYVAYAHLVSGSTDEAAGVVRALVTFFDRYRHRFDDVISGAVDPAADSARPHVRFAGESLSEISSERWPHAQNDALGYFLWLASLVAAVGAIRADPPVVSVLTRLLQYFKAIRFWQDEDSGHWEERRKVSASSIGTVVAGLDALLDLLRSQAIWRQRLGPQMESAALELVERGREALAAILPHECAQIDGAKNRRYDAALLFLLFPLGAVADEAMADAVLHDVDRFLAGEHGIRRYLGDSYWAPDYDLHLAPADRTRDFSDGLDTRDALLPRIGDEAQWCLFDPVLSAYYGRRYRRTRSLRDRQKQIEHFNRSLSQLTPDWRCAELYYLRNGEYVSNPHVPLQWTQANLVLALHEMRAALG